MMMVKVFRKRIFLALALVAAAAFLLPPVAQAVDVGARFGAATGLAATDPRVIAARIIQIVLGFLGLIAVSLVIYAGFLWMTSSGDESKIEKAKLTLRNAVIGLAVILSAFGITTFVLAKLMSATGPGGAETPAPPSAVGGMGALGACSVESVYPTPDQKEVARNSSIIVTFKEAVRPGSICVANAAGRCEGANILTDGTIKIFKTKDDPDNFITNVRVYDTIDAKTFIFVPGEYLGSPSEYLWYTVSLGRNKGATKLGSDIVKPDGRSIFESCRDNFMEWQFEVSNKIDLTPPQVKDSGVFPPPDNTRDTVSVSSVAVKATGAITVSAAPNVYTPASAGPVTANSSPVATVKADDSCLEGGNLLIAVGADGAATVNRGGTRLGAATVSDQTIKFNNILTLTSSGPIIPGNSWSVNVTAMKEADTLSVGDIVYSFVTATSAPNHIKLGASDSQTAAAIASVITKTHPGVAASASGGKVSLEARVAGPSANSLVLASTNNAAFTITRMAGGSSRSETVTVNGKKDQPRNAALQINFDEPVMPITLAGTADQVANYIRVVNADPTAKAQNVACTADAECRSFKCVSGFCNGANNYMMGKFTIANQYQTVEFTSDNQCGVNGCGDPIYCLPEMSNLRVEIVAASLATCSGDPDCAASSPFNTCSGVCQNSSGKNYPLANKLSLNGVVDTCFNSLDGNRDGFSAGPLSFYNQNSGSAASGDNYSWSFFVSDKMDITPPVVEDILPRRGNETDVKDPLEATFNKIMMAKSLVSGTTQVDTGNKVVTHKNLNIWSLAKVGVGYWIESQWLDTNSDGDPEKTKAFIRHTDFDANVSYRAQIGSGAKDIYQNCFKPSNGFGCAGVGESAPSCCNGTAAAALGPDGNCP